MKFFAIHRRSLLALRPALALALGAGIFISTGCKKKPAAQAVAAVPVAEVVATPVAGGKPVFLPPPVAPAVNPSADGGADLKQLNHAYIGWIVQSHRRPKTFEEFVAASGIQVAPAPAGKKYVIEKSGFINVVSQ